MDNQQEINIVPGKSAIIGKIWNNSKESSIIPNSFVLPQDMSFGKDEQYLIGNLNFRTDRHLNTSTVHGESKSLELKKGEILYFFSNEKRDGKRDPDLSVSIRCNAELADTIIDNNRKGLETWRNEQNAI